MRRVLTLRAHLLPWPIWQEPITVGWQAGRDGFIEGVRDAAGAVLEGTIEAVEDRNGLPDFRGPLVHGRPCERFLYVAWRTVASEPQRFRRLKLFLSPVERSTWVQPAIPWSTIEVGGIEATVPGAEPDGTPACGSKPIRWAPMKRP